MEDWDQVQQVVVDTLTPPVSKLKLKAKIQRDNAKQEPTELVIDFLERLQLLVDHCYDQPNQEDLKDHTLKELQLRGLKDDVVSIDVLTQREDLPLQELVKLAMKKELAMKAREYVKKPAGEKGTVTVFSVSDKSYNFHFVLLASNLRVEGIHQMYNAIPVPMNEPEDPETCMGVQLPTPIFKANGKFFTADITDCQQHNALLVCRFPAIAKSA